MKLRNVNPIGHVDLPLLNRQGHPDDKVEHVEDPDRPGIFNEVALEGDARWGVGCLEPGEEFDVTAAQARDLLAQVGNYEPADDAAAKIAAKIAGHDTAPDPDVPVEQEQKP